MWTYSLAGVKLALNHLLADLNKKFNLSIKLTISKDLPLENTYYNSVEQMIFLGFKDFSLGDVRAKPRRVSRSELTKIVQYMVHEFFHSEQERRILTNPFIDKQLTADYLLTEIFYDFYKNNHTLSLLEIDTERKSWKYLSEKMPGTLIVSQSRCDRILYSLFATMKNSFFEYADPYVVDMFFMRLPGATHEGLDSFLQTLEIKSRNSIRKTPDHLDGYLDVSNCNNVCDQIIEILDRPPNIPSPNPLIHKARNEISRLLVEAPDLISAVKSFPERTTEKDFDTEP